MVFAYDGVPNAGPRALSEVRGRVRKPVRENIAELCYRVRPRRRIEVEFGPQLVPQASVEFQFQRISSWAIS